MLLSEEEIKESKELCLNLLDTLGTGLVKFGETINLGSKDVGYVDAIKNLLQYVKELEESNKDLDHENNRLEKIEFEKDMAYKIIDEMADSMIGIIYYHMENEDDTLEKIFSTKEEVINYFKDKVNKGLNRGNYNVESKNEKEN